MVEDGSFRKDLWFRLNVVHIHLPPLRERRADIAPLAEHFLRQLNGRYQRRVHFAADAVKALEEYAWPGNVRQLEHLLERLVILSPIDTLDGAAICEALMTLEPSQKKVESLADAEEEQIRKVLAATGGNKSRAAEILNIERKTLYRKLDRMKL
jgi:DNA-binding NtrC family response regulator